MTAQLQPNQANESSNKVSHNQSNAIANILNRLNDDMGLCSPLIGIDIGEGSILSLVLDAFLFNDISVASVGTPLNRQFSRHANLSDSNLSDNIFAPRFQQYHQRLLSYLQNNIGIFVTLLRKKTGNASLLIADLFSFLFLYEFYRNTYHVINEIPNNDNDMVQYLHKNLNCSNREALLNALSNQHENDGSVNNFSHYTIMQLLEEIELCLEDMLLTCVASGEIANEDILRQVHDGLITDVSQQYGNTEEGRHAQKQRQADFAAHTVKNTDNPFSGHDVLVENDDVTPDINISSDKPLTLFTFDKSSHTRTQLRPTENYYLELLDELTWDNRVGVLFSGGEQHDLKSPEYIKKRGDGIESLYASMFEHIVLSERDIEICKNFSTVGFGIASLLLWGLFGDEALHKNNYLNLITRRIKRKICPGNTDILTPSESAAYHIKRALFGKTILQAELWSSGNYNHSVSVALPASDETHTFFNQRSENETTGEIRAINAVQTQPSTELLQSQELQATHFENVASQSVEILSENWLLNYLNRSGPVFPNDLVGAIMEALINSDVLDGLVKTVNSMSSKSGRTRWIQAITDNNGRSFPDLFYSAHLMLTPFITRFMLKTLAAQIVLNITAKGAHVPQSKSPQPVNHHHANKNSQGATEPQTTQTKTITQWAADWLHDIEFGPLESLIQFEKISEWFALLGIKRDSIMEQSHQVEQPNDNETLQQETPSHDTREQTWIRFFESQDNLASLLSNTLSHLNLSVLTSPLSVLIWSSMLVPETHRLQVIKEFQSIVVHDNTDRNGDNINTTPSPSGTIQERDVRLNAQLSNELAELKRALLNSDCMQALTLAALMGRTAFKQYNADTKQTHVEHAQLDSILQEHLTTQNTSITAQRLVLISAYLQKARAEDSISSISNTSPSKPQQNTNISNAQTRLNNRVNMDAILNNLKTISACNTPGCFESFISQHQIDIAPAAYNVAACFNILHTLALLEQVITAKDT